ncbi:MAG TPA: hypothetical protein DDZ91_14450 [Firmicutes bacterium]|jgi:hypothetical protein|nr:hypothetical protein [Bacillota bacterium]
MQEAVKYLTDNLDELEGFLTKAERKTLAENIKRNLIERPAKKLRRYDYYTAINSKRITVDVSVFSTPRHEITAWVTCVDIINRKYLSITI